MVSLIEKLAIQAIQQILLLVIHKFMTHKIIIIAFRFTEVQNNSKWETTVSFIMHDCKEILAIIIHIFMEHFNLQDK